MSATKTPAKTTKPCKPAKAKPVEVKPHAWTDGGERVLILRRINADSKTASSGDYSTAASSGDYSKAEAKGSDTVACVAGHGGAVRVGERGAFAIPYWSEADGWRFLCGKVGENGIKADTWYRVKDGALEEAA